MKWSKHKESPNNQRLGHIQPAECSVQQKVGFVNYSLLPSLKWACTLAIAVLKPEFFLKTFV